MTEREWQQCRDSASMLEFLRGKASGRKLRLLACALVRSVRLAPTGKTAWELLEECNWFFELVRFPITDEPCRDTYWLPPEGPGDGYGYLFMTARQAIEAMEEHADGRISQGRLAAAECYASYIGWAAEADTFKPATDPPDSKFHEALAGAVADTTSNDEGLVGSLQHPKNWYTALNAPPDDYEGEDYGKEHDDQVCDLIREIFNPFRPPPVAIADDQRQILLPLQCVYDAGAFDVLPTFPGRFVCGSACPEIASHFRSDAPHLRGCWAVDELLGLS